MDGNPSYQVDLGAALRWAIATFRSNFLAFISLAAVVTAVQFLQIVSISPLENFFVECVDPQTPGQQAACTSSIGSPAMISAVLVIGLQILIYLTTVGVIRGALWSTGGRSPDFSALLTGKNLGVYLVVAFFYALLLGLGILMLILPGLLVILFLQFAPYFAVDQGTGLFRSFAGSARIARKNFGAATMATLVNLVALLVGGMFFGLITLVALPFAALFTAYIYRQMLGQSVVG